MSEPLSDREIVEQEVILAEQELQARQRAFWAKTDLGHRAAQAILHLVFTAADRGGFHERKRLADAQEELGEALAALVVREEKPPIAKEDL